MTLKSKIAVVLVDTGRLLLIKEWSNKKKGYYWNLIKGTYGDHEGETLEICAKREALEEAGVNIEIDCLISCYLAMGNDVGIQFNFLAHPKDKNAVSIVDKEEQKLRGEDITELKWFTKEELSKMDKDQFINNRISMVINDYLKNERYSFDVIPEWN